MKSLLILKFPYSSLFGGGEKHTLRLVEYWMAQGWNVRLVTSCHVLREEFVKRGWRVRRWWAGTEPVTSKSLMLFPLTLPFVALSFCFQLVWSRYRYGTRVLYCLSLTDKVIATPLAHLLGMRVIWMEHVNFGRWILQSPLKRLYVRWSQYVTIVVVSESLKKDVLAVGVAEDRIRVIKNGIDCDEPNRVPHDKVLKFPRRFVVGVMARLVEEKGIEYLIKAVAQVKEIIPHVQLVIAGEGPDRRNLEWTATQLGIKENVRFLGFVKEIYQVMLGFDVFVLPSSKRESSGMVLVQAMASRVPCIGTRLGGIPEIIHDGETGMLVPVEDPTAISERIIYLYFHPEERLRLATRAREFVLAEHSEERMLQRFDEVIG